MVTFPVGNWVGSFDDVGRVGQLYSLLWSDPSLSPTQSSPLLKPKPPGLPLCNSFLPLCHSRPSGSSFISSHFSSLLYLIVSVYSSSFNLYLNFLLPAMECRDVYMLSLFFFFFSLKCQLLSVRYMKETFIKFFI